MRFLLGAAIPLALLLAYLYLSLRLRHPARKVSPAALVETAWLVLLIIFAYHLMMVFALLWELPGGLGPDPERNPFWAGFELPYAPAVQFSHVLPFSAEWSIIFALVGMFLLLFLIGLAVRFFPIRQLHGRVA
jgi:hypothetical protein